MSDDIVARLREAAENLSEIYPDYGEAADEIERLRAELAAERERVAAYQAHIIRCDNSLKQYQYERDALRAELAAETETVLRLTAELSGVKSCLKSTEKHFARAKGNTKSMKLARNAARAERDALRELLREARICLDGWDGDMCAHIDAALKEDGDGRG